MKFLTKTAALLLAATFAVVANAAAPYLGKSVVAVLEELRAQGNQIAYSNILVPVDLEVTVEPTASAPMSAILEILELYGLTLQPDRGVYLVVRAPRPEPPLRQSGVAAQPDASIENITVLASRYEISGDTSTSKFEIDQHSIENMPDLGSDPIRITQRLPGAAASGASARAHFRGGELNEVSIILNGQRLFDPFHVRDYQNIFSTIDSRAIDRVEVFTGGFPAKFGDRMSGVVVLESIDPEDPRHTEIGISVFNTSFLLSGSDDDKRWLFSARRGNLDQVIDQKFGRPSYYDVFSQFEFSLGDNTTVSANALFAEDLVTVVLETDPDEREEASSDTQNVQAWLQFDTEWSERLASRTAISYTGYDNRRLGSTSDFEKVVANVRDDRDVTEVGFRQDWTYRPSDVHLLQWGFGTYISDATFSYDGSADYFGLTALFPGQAATVTRSVNATPSGGSYAVYVADRWKLSPTTVLEWGLRWDDQTYTDLSSDSQLSPRIGVLRRWGEKTEFRASWGRYHQSQGIQELQVEDGLSNYWPAQRADHLIAGVQHQFNDKLTMRVEAFHKDMQDVRPRFENLFDPLALIPELQADRVRLEPSSAKSAGLEVSLSGNRGEFSWWSSYTLSKVQDRIGGRNEPRSWDQRHALQGGVGWSMQKWDVSIAAGAHSGWRTTDLNLMEGALDGDGEPTFVAVPGLRNALELGEFASLDFRISRRFDVRRGSLSAFFEVSNTLNRRNTCCVDWDIAENASDDPMLENSLDYWLPLLPAVGILWEF